ncbi:MAG: hypothetical protein MHM6MM_002063 [Cercozoa sp. M6MM]
MVQLSIGVKLGVAGFFLAAGVLLLILGGAVGGSSDWYIMFTLVPALAVAAIQALFGSTGGNDPFGAEQKSNGLQQTVEFFLGMLGVSIIGIPLIMLHVSLISGTAFGFVCGSFASFLLCYGVATLGSSQSSDMY